MKKVLLYMPFSILLMSAISILSSCSNDDPETNPVENTFTLTHGTMEMTVSTSGARIMKLCVPDRDGVMRDVVLGFDSPEQYGAHNNNAEYGAVVGRYANRIKDGELTIDGQSYQLPKNNNGNCLHGGDGWHTKNYELVERGKDYIHMAIVSPDGDNGFPGKVTAHVKYTLQDNGVLRIDYSATTTKATVINMTNHVYFNLSAQPNSDVREHQLSVRAQGYTPVDAYCIPTAYSTPVEGTTFDFRTQRFIANEYDHNYVLSTNCDLSVEAAYLYCDKTGIYMRCYTTEPGVQVYTGNNIAPLIKGKEGVVYAKHAGICLETEHCPDSPHHADWPTTLLQPGDTYQSTTIYQFGHK